MGMTARVALVRHGRTALNADGRLRGRLDPPLDDIGVDEAEAAARELARSRVTTIVSSPLVRARETAQAVARTTGVPVEIDPRLADRDYREFAGARADDLVRDHGSLDAVPGIEPRIKVAARALAALESHARDDDGVLVIVSHDAVIGILLEELGVDPHRLAIPTGSITALTRRDGRWSVQHIGVTPGE